MEPLFPLLHKLHYDESQIQFEFAVDFSQNLTKSSPRPRWTDGKMFNSKQVPTDLDPFLIGFLTRCHGADYDTDFFPCHMHITIGSSDNQRKANNSNVDLVTLKGIGFKVLVQSLCDWPDGRL